MKRRRPLTRENWMAIAEKMRQGFALIHECQVALQETLTLADQRRIRLPGGRLKCRLDSIVVAQHPQWAEATRIFYGGWLPIG